jgi:CheY-like chemotaxis protein
MMPLSTPPKNDQRYKFAKLQLLVADSDVRSAQLIKTLLMSFGIRKIDLVYSAQEALHALRTRRVDLLVTEQVLEPVTGLDLVKTIRAAKNDKLLHFDMPIIMLTAHSDAQQVLAARDAGITEFVAKPFSARSFSTRLIEIIDSPRAFVEAPNYKGPSRRRRAAPPPGVEDRRGRPDQRTRPDGGPKVNILRANRSLHEMLGSVDAADILIEEVISEAQIELMKAEGDFVIWVKDDIAKLEAAYSALATNPTNNAARENLLDAAYTIKSQAGIFGYDLGTHVADMLITYLGAHILFSPEHLVVTRKHIDTMSVIFTQKVKDAKGDIGQSLVDSLSKLVVKFS